jgi:CubicO group peptidase (beta-lactamase class C family)
MERATQEGRVTTSESLTLAAERIESFARARLSLPGLAVGLVGPGGWRHEFAVGVADVAAGRPLDPTALMPIASVSKAMTAVALLREQEAGRIDIDDPVHDHLPWLPLATPFGPISVAHLLAHIAGIVAGMEGSPSPVAEARPWPRPRPGGRRANGPATPTSGTPCSGWSWNGSPAAPTARRSRATSSIPVA